MSTCPRCRAQLCVDDVPSAAMLGCHACGGVWVDAAGCASLAREARPEVLARARQLAEGASVKQSVDGALACPVCAPALERVALPSGVVIDRCAQHGTWFDDGELRAALLLDDAERASALPYQQEGRSPLWQTLGSAAGAVDLVLALGRLFF